jgi:hypothetical protein
VLLLVIADLAWATAIGTTGPWFGATVSLAVYSVALVVAVVIASVVAHEAIARRTSLDATLVRLDRRLALLRAASAARNGRRTEELDLDLPLDAFEPGGEAPLVRIDREGHDTLVPLPARARSPSTAAHVQVLAQLAQERTAVREARARVTALAAGPVVASLVFVAVAGPMLPGSDAFAAAHYTLNTTAILFLSYSLAPLLAWSLIALGLMASAGYRSSA